jgi:phosphogluconate dehydratase
VPEARDGGLIGKIQTGDLIKFDAIHGVLTCLTPDVELRETRTKDNSEVFGLGREMFANMRTMVTSSEEGASFI